MKSRKQDTRTEKDEKLKDANRELRADNRKLRKQVATLQKRLQQVADWQWLADNTEPAEEEDTEVYVPPAIPKCPECGDEIEVVHAGIFTIKKCTSCRWRQRT